jgi:hypothetical protein
MQVVAAEVQIQRQQQQEREDLVVEEMEQTLMQQPLQEQKIQVVAAEGEVLQRQEVAETAAQAAPV